jgi:hypothetical protein
LALPYQYLLGNGAGGKARHDQAQRKQERRWMIVVIKIIKIKKHPPFPVLYENGRREAEPFFAGSRTGGFTEGMEKLTEMSTQTSAGFVGCNRGEDKEKRKKAKNIGRQAVKNMSGCCRL